MHAVVNTVQFVFLGVLMQTRARTHARTQAGQIVSLSAYDPRGQPPTAAPVAPSESLNDLSKQRPQNLAERERCFIYRLHKRVLFFSLFLFLDKVEEISQTALNIENPGSGAVGLFFRLPVLK